MDEFIRQLLQEAGVPDSTDPEVYQQLTKDLQDRAADMVNHRLIEAMSDDDVAAFEQVLDNEPENMSLMQQFIDEHVPDKEQITARALLEFRALYLGKSA